ncbi:MAG: sigma-70 family RNA polymerase sigma factor [Bacteroidota bacterium]
MEDYQAKLFPYAYNILGSAEDAKDAIQDVLLKYHTLNTNIDNVIGYLVKGVINQSINFKHRKKKISADQVWLPEPIATERSDSNLNREDIISYSMLVLLEQLNPKERAVFILKEAFDYSHQEIADIIDSTIENSRKLLSRAKDKLKASRKNNGDPGSSSAPSFMQSYIEIIKNGDIKALEGLLSEEISLTADGGDKVNVVRTFTSGRSAVSDLILTVYRNYQQSQTVRIAEVNHQPALLYYENDLLVNCQVFQLNKDNTLISNVYSVVDPDKLKALF